MAFMPSALGLLVVTVLKMLMSTRNRVINIAMRPGTTSGGTRKLTHDTTTNRPEKGVIRITSYSQNLQIYLATLSQKQINFIKI